MANEFSETPMEIARKDRERRKAAVEAAKNPIRKTSAVEPTYSQREQENAAKPKPVENVEPNTETDKIREQGGFLISKGPKGR